MELPAVTIRVISNTGPLAEAFKQFATAAAFRATTEATERLHAALADHDHCLDANTLPRKMRLPHTHAGTFVFPSHLEHPLPIAPHNHEQHNHDTTAPPINSTTRAIIKKHTNATSLRKSNAQH